MSDFSEICPLFNTGVFNEVVFPNVALTDVSICANALLATADAMVSALGNWVFSRTVVITAAWIKKVTNVKGTTNAQLVHHTSKLAAGTIFASLRLSTTITGQCTGYAYLPMTLTETTFTSAAILGLIPGVVTAASGGLLDLVVRYKEK